MVGERKVDVVGTRVNVLKDWVVNVWVLVAVTVTVLVMKLVWKEKLVVVNVAPLEVKVEV